MATDRMALLELLGKAARGAAVDGELDGDRRP
jgi:hypothetical protein